MLVSRFPAFAITLLLGCSAFSGPAFADGFEDGPFAGRVIDATTHESVGGAIVLAHWDRLHESIGGSWKTCNHLAVVATDAQGRYHIDRWPRAIDNPIDWLFGVKFWVTISAYRAGMTDPPFPTNSFDAHTGDIRLVKFEGTRSQRMKDLGRDAIFECPEADHSLKLLRAFREAVYAEARSTATNSTQDQQTLWGIWRQVQALGREGPIVTAPDSPAALAPIPATNPAPVVPGQSLPQSPATHPL